MDEYNMPFVARAQLDEYANEKRTPGSFIRAVLENDLKKAVSYGDEIHIAAIAAIVKYMCNKMPSMCSGSPDKVKEWLASK